MVYEMQEAKREFSEGVLRAHHEKISRIAAAYEPPGAGRDDLIQDIVHALLLAWPRFRGDCSERTFVYRVATNRCLEHLRVRYRQTERLSLVRGSSACAQATWMPEWKTTIFETE